MTIRNLSGVYIFEKLEGEENERPICFEDCKDETQTKWLYSLDKPALISLAKKLGEKIKQIGCEFDIIVK